MGRLGLGGRWLNWQEHLGVSERRDREGERFCGFGAKGTALAERGSSKEVTVATALTGGDAEAAVERGSWASSNGVSSALPARVPHGLGKTAQIYDIDSE